MIWETSILILLKLLINMLQLPILKKYPLFRSIRECNNEIALFLIIHKSTLIFLITNSGQYTFPVFFIVLSCTNVLLHPHHLVSALSITFPILKISFVEKVLISLHCTLTFHEIVSPVSLVRPPIFLVKRSSTLQLPFAKATNIFIPILPFKSTNTRYSPLSHLPNIGIPCFFPFTWSPTVQSTIQSDTLASISITSSKCPFAIFLTFFKKPLVFVTVRPLTDPNPFHQIIASSAGADGVITKFDLPLALLYIVLILTLVFITILLT